MVSVWFQMSLRHLLTTIFDAGILKPKYLFKIYSFIKIQNIHTKQIHFFKNPEYSFKKLFTLFKARIFIQQKFSFFLKEAVSPRQGYLGIQTNFSYSNLGQFSWAPVFSTTRDLNHQCDVIFKYPSKIWAESWTSEYKSNSKRDQKSA